MFANTCSTLKSHVRCDFVPLSCGQLVDYDKSTFTRYEEF